MSAYKQFLTSDIIVTPFEVNKSFTFTGGALTGSNVGIDRFLGLNTSSLFDPLTDPTTGQNGTQYQRLIYNSIKELYYSNYLNGLINYGLPPSTASLIPGSDPSGDVYIGPTSSAGRYWNYPQTTLTFQHYFPTSSDSIIGVLSIPSGLFGSYIQPGSFIWTADSGSIYDDGQGNLLFSGTDDICGNIFYAHGIAVITTCSFDGASLYGGAIYGTSIYGATTGVILNMVTSSNITCSFSSSLTIYETQYKCTISENEFNFSQNPSILSGSSDEFLYDFATGSYFNPYVTTVGLYNENQDLIAVGKLAQPLITSNTTDTTILVNIDR